MDFIVNKIDSFMKILASQEWIRKMAYIYEDNTANYILLFFILITVYLLYVKIVEAKKNKELYIIPNKLKSSKNENNSLLSNLNYLKSLKNAISYYHFFTQNSKAKEARLYFLIMLLELGIVTASIIINKFVLGFLIAIISHYIILIIIKTSSKNIDDVVSEELPMIIKHFVKTLSKTGDLKVVIYDTSKHIKQPLKAKFEQLSRYMLSEDDEKCLTEFAEEVNSIWMYTFIFLVLSLKQHSKKEDVIENLKLLAKILEDDNNTRARELAEKKPMIMMNSSVAVLAIIAMTVNIIFNDVARDFFFNSVNGMLVFVVGVGCILGTLMINTILSKKAEGG